MDETTRVVVHDAWHGLLTQQSIIDQLVHTAALNGLTPVDLNDGGLPAWNALASHAFAIEDESIQLRVLKQLGEVTG